LYLCHMEYLNSFHFYGVKNLLGDNNGFIEMQREPILLRYPKLNNYLSDDWVIPVQSKLDILVIGWIIVGLMCGGLGIVVWRMIG